MTMTFDKARKLMPVCVVGSPMADDAKTINDLRFAALHEIDCFESQEDGCLSAVEIKQVRKYLSRIGGNIE